jgi:tetratricopeptide (TPR) repeat protein
MVQADAAVPAWLAAIEWDRRSAAFGPLHVSNGVIATVYAPLSSDAALPAPAARLRALWLDLAAHPNILTPIDDDPYPGRLVVEYPAIDWGFTPAPLVGGEAPQRRVATWGLQLCEVFDVIRRAVDADERGYFTSPRPYVDIDDHVRVGFDAAAADGRDAPPELRKQWPRCDEAGLVYVVGATLAKLVTEQRDSAVTDVIARCTAAKPHKRYGSLALVGKAFEGALGSKYAVRRHETFIAWRTIETGLGWLAMGRPTTACEVIEGGPREYTYRMLRAAVLAETRRQRGLPEEPAYAPAPAPVDAVEAGGWRDAIRAPASRLPWADAVAEGARLEAAHRDREALAIYERGAPPGPQVSTRFLAIARCLYALGDTGPAIDYARRALVHEPDRAEAYSIQYRARLERREPGEALAVVERWLAIAPQLGAVHHARGRALLALGRLDDAADSFDRALTLDGTLLGAMLLRRELERARGVLRATVGRQRAVAFDLPARFVRARAALIDGDTARAITVLGEPGYAHDGTAQVLLGNCLAAAGRFDDAVAVFDRAAGMAPDVERAALEGMARALESLGRGAEADALHRRLADDAAAGAELRVRTSR